MGAIDSYAFCLRGESLVENPWGRGKDYRFSGQGRTEATERNVCNYPLFFCEMPKEIKTYSNIFAPPYQQAIIIQAF